MKLCGYNDGFEEFQLRHWQRFSPSVGFDCFGDRFPTQDDLELSNRAGTVVSEAQDKGIKAASVEPPPSRLPANMSLPSSTRVDPSMLKSPHKLGKARCFSGEKA